jgi:hypothetical protein
MIKNNQMMFLMASTVSICLSAVNPESIKVERPAGKLLKINCRPVEGILSTRNT